MSVTSDSTAKLISSKKWRIALGWVVTPFFDLFFILILLVFHPFLVIARLLGYLPHKLLLDCMNFCLIQNFKVAGTFVSVNIEDYPPKGRPLIIVSNHQSMYDIPVIMWVLRDWHPKFIAKKELGRWLPSISFSLRHMGSVLIDRKDPKQAIPAIEDFGRQIEKNCWAACIFPEGTRARDGQMKKFKSSGIKTLLKTIPSAYITPVVIEGSWEMLRYKLFPIPFGCRFEMHVLKGFDNHELNPENAAEKLENIIRTKLEEIRESRRQHQQQ
ncbi:MAG: 1-acyl-sn-glycerol-3-phosphate acyltransferase [Candidatus Dadabacteria bacterium]|nr:MAG: 1-acyl-sn-glycerol-3-phosphate acyltransferase [Candidatus Dadabacteria bacterium]